MGNGEWSMANAVQFGLPGSYAHFPKMAKPPVNPAKSCSSCEIQLQFWFTRKELTVRQSKDLCSPTPLRFCTKLLALLLAWAVVVLYHAAVAQSGREIRAVSINAMPGQNVTVTLELVSQGDENAVGFSVNFNPALLAYLLAGSLCSTRIPSPVDGWECCWVCSPTRNSPRGCGNW
jgi:hypothetical protein